jgi:purine-binding chemotaxis protein CheW
MAVATASEWLIAAVAGGRYGLPVGSVGEILEVPDPTRVPLAPDFLHGVVNNKGEILPVVDASTLLTDHAGPVARIAVVVRHRGVTFGLLVEGVDGIRWVAGEAVSKMSGSGYRERFFSGTARSDDSLVTLIDLDGLVPFITSSLEAISAEGAIR